MTLPPQKPATTPMPVPLSAHDCTAFILPHLSLPRGGPKCTLGSHRLLNLIVWGLYPGLQWQCLPIPTQSEAALPGWHEPEPYREPTQPQMYQARAQAAVQ